MNRGIAKRGTALAVAWCLTATAGDFAILNIRVVEGEGMVYGTGSRATRGITVEVTNESGAPVPDVSVSFRLPDEGPSGVFNTGARSDIVTTRQDGRASVWGMKWNRIPGPVLVRITAAKDGVRAGLVSTQTLSDAPAITSTGNIRSNSHSKLLWISLIALGAAAGGGMAFGMGHGTSTTPASPQVALSVGTPSVIVGAP